MRYLMWIVMMAWLTGCAAQGRLIETQEPLMTGCSMLGVISETANAGIVSAYAAKRLMLNRVQERALQLGATHIVWLHRTDHAAAARTFRCQK
jgi:hypothetical protein